MFSQGPFYLWLVSLQGGVIVQREKVTGDVNNNLGWHRPREPTAFVPPSLLWCTPDMKLNLIGFKLRWHCKCHWCQTTMNYGQIQGKLQYDLHQAEAENTSDIFLACTVKSITFPQFTVTPPPQHGSPEITQHQTLTHSAVGGEDGEQALADRLRRHLYFANETEKF